MKELALRWLAMVGLFSALAFYKDAETFSIQYWFAVGGVVTFFFGFEALVAHQAKKRGGRAHDR